jgi:hypothetical protein
MVHTSGIYDNKNTENYIKRHNKTITFDNGKYIITKG